MVGQHAEECMQDGTGKNRQDFAESSRIRSGGRLAWLAGWHLEPLLWQSYFRFGWGRRMFVEHIAILALSVKSLTVQSRTVPIGENGLGC